MSSSNKKMNKVNFFLNTYEQQIQIENRLKELFECLKLSDQIRTDTEQSKQKIRDELNHNYEQLKDDLSKLSNKIYKKIEIEIIKKQIDTPIRSTENDINQLIGNLNSLSLLNDSEKLLCLKQIDSSIQQIKENLNSIESYRKSHVDNFYSSQHHLSQLVRNQIANIENKIRTESINLNSHLMNQTEDLESKNWLLSQKHLDETKSNLKKTNSFEIINYDKEWAHVLEEFDDCDTDMIKQERVKGTYVNFNVSERFDVVKNDIITKLFNNIYAKPMDYWLLNQS